MAGTSHQRALARGLAALAALGLGWSELAAGPRQSGATVDWIGVGGSVGEPHYGDIAQIDRATVKRLGLAWSLDLPDEHTLQATPLAIGGTLYFSGQGAKVYAVDAVSGHLLWSYDPETWKYRPRVHRLNFQTNRGVAYAEGKVIVCTLDGRLIALDAKSGKPAWSVKTMPDEGYLFSTGAPRIVGDKVVIGNGGGDVGARGYVTAYDVATGRQAWRFHIVPGNPADGFENAAMRMAAATWSGKWWEIGSGGGPWNAMTYDPALGLLYVGTGNAGPGNPRLRNPGGGDNLFVASIVALKADTGEYVWHYQVNPNEAWDYKATADMILADLTIAGRRRQVIMQAPTNGFFYVLDRRTGELLSAEKYDKVTWAERIDLETGRPVEAPGIRYEKTPIRIWPGVMGAHNWQAMAYSPKTGLVYFPVHTVSALFSDVPELVAHPMKRTPESPYTGATAGDVEGAPEDGAGGLLAWDPVAQTQRWRVPYPHMWNGGALATAGDLVFQGDGEGIFHAYDAATGRELWRFDAGLGIVAAPITYTAGGRQYVSVLVGYGGGANVAAPHKVSRGWKYGLQPRRLLTFALDGRGRLPPTPPRDATVRALDDPALTLDPTVVLRGAIDYGGHCASCHGMRAASPGIPAPDLRESAVAFDQAALKALLQNGGLEPHGMPRYDEITDDRVRDIWTYIRSTAREALTAEKRGAESGSGG